MEVCIDDGSPAPSMHTTDELPLFYVPNDIKAASLPQGPPSRLGLCQLRALLGQQVIHRYRTPLSTFMELFSPSLMMMTLVVAFLLAGNDNIPSRSYTKMNLEALPLTQLMLDLNIITPRASSKTGNSTESERRLYEDDDGDFNWISSSDQSWESRFLNWGRHIEEVFRPNNNDRYAQSRRLQTSLSALNRIRRSLDSLYKGPVPIPSLEQFVAISNEAKSVIQAEDYSAIASPKSPLKGWKNVFTPGTVHVVDPSNSFWDFVLLKHPSVEADITIRHHNSSADALAYMAAYPKERTWALLDLCGLSDSLHVDRKYEIRMDYDSIVDTNRVLQPTTGGLSESDGSFGRYYRSGYLTWQRTINEFVYESAGGSCPAMIQNGSSVWSMPMPTAPWSRNSFYGDALGLAGYILWISMLFPFSRLVKQMVEEKESKMKETLTIIGVRPWAYMSSWLIVALTSFMIVAVLTTLTVSWTVFQYTSFWLLLAWLVLTGAALVGFGFFLAACISRTKVAAVVAPVGLFTSMMPWFIFYGVNEDVYPAAKRLLSLLPGTAFGLGADVLLGYEFTGQGVNSSNAHDGGYSFATSLRFLSFDFFLYLLLAWCIDQTRSGSPIMPFQWRGCRSRGGQNSEEHELQRKQTVGGTCTSRDLDEGMDPSGSAVVRLCNLVKRFGRKASGQMAVNDLSLNLYDSQITALLGHNGAGKTTTISMLTGLIAPTFGDCLIFGTSIVHNKAEARVSLGYCPQHDTLFDRLTVFEHISLFQRLKGIHPTSSSVLACIEELGLGDYVYTTVDALSGGTKRKLSVAIALSGDSKLIVLDEPTSGMDPSSRRACWEVLRQKRQGRVILFTTHFMDEAEFLSDRIAILKDGVLRCAGSSMYLKRQFELGYYLTVVKDQNRAEEFAAGVGSLTGPSKTDDAVLRYLAQFIPRTQLVRSVGKETTFLFPPGSESSFNDVFVGMESKRSELGLTAFGVKGASIEELFVVVTDGDHSLGASGEESWVESSFKTTEAVRVPKSIGVLLSGDSSDTDSTQSGSLKTSHSLKLLSWVEQVMLLYWKRVLIQTRDYKSIIFSVILPSLTIAFVLLILLVDLTAPGPAIELTPDLFKFTSGVSPLSVILDPSAATSFPDGETRPAAVLVAGGPSLQANETWHDTMHSNLRTFQANTNETYGDWISVVLLRQVLSSNQLSAYMLDNYFDHPMRTRYGAFTFSDVIEVSASLNSTDKGELGLGTEFMFADMFTKSSTKWELEMNNSNWGNENDGTAVDSDEVFDINNVTKAAFFLSPFIGESPLQTALMLSAADGFSLSTVFSNGTREHRYQLEVDVSLMHNQTSAHSVAVFNQLYSEHLYKTCTLNKSSRLVSVNHPLPLTKEQSVSNQVTVSILTSLFLLVPFCYVPGAYVAFVVKERACKSTHLQLVSGACSSAYWIAGYLWDLTIYFTFTLCVMAVFMMYGHGSAAVFVGNPESFLCTFALTFGYGMSVLPFSYLLSRNFTNHGSAQITVIAVVFVTGFVALNFYSILSGIDSTQQVAGALQYVFRLWPAYNLGEGLMKLSSAYSIEGMLGTNVNLFGWNNAGTAIALLYGLAVPYMGLLLVLESIQKEGSSTCCAGLLHRCREYFDRKLLYWSGVRENDGKLLLNDGLDERSQRPDEDVEAESMFVQGKIDYLKETAPVVFLNLWKIYPASNGLLGTALGLARMTVSSVINFVCGKSRHSSQETEREKHQKFPLPKRALRGVTTAVREGEIYALLGQNGAGKSTTIGILTGETGATAGSVYVAGNSITGNGLQEARRHIGLCPQVNPLLDGMTGRETLRMYARLRGIASDDVNDVVDCLLNQLTLCVDADKPTEQYSGGNKRKLSLGIALIGDPKVLLIDEPSTGLDPVSKRKGMWKLISEIARDRSVILTTHSMEEAEALCTRAGVMVDGKLLCLGPVQHLKSKYGDGYTVDLICHPRSDMDSVESYILHEFPSSRLLERHGRFVRFSLPNVSSTIGLGPAFSKLQAMRNRSVDAEGWQVEDYSLAQSTLEQVYLQLLDRGDTTATPTDGLFHIEITSLNGEESETEDVVRKKPSLEVEPGGPGDSSSFGSYLVEVDSELRSCKPFAPSEPVPLVRSETRRPVRNEGDESDFNIFPQPEPGRCRVVSGRSETFRVPGEPRSARESGRTGGAIPSRADHVNTYAL